MSVNPYQFEPQKKVVNNSNNDSDDSWEDVPDCPEEVREQEPRINRLDVEPSSWCKCSFCCTMPVSRECLCCTEIDEIKLRYISGDYTCVTQHESFDAVCLNPHVLWTAMVSLNDREGAWLPCIDNIPNRTYRYAAYRQFSWFVYTKLGRHVRRIIPACVVSKIRKKFPEENGIYVNFDGDDEGADGMSEIIQAWEYMTSEEQNR